MRIWKVIPYPARRASPHANAAYLSRCTTTRTRTIERDGLNGLRTHVYAEFEDHCPLPCSNWSIQQLASLCRVVNRAFRIPPQPDLIFPESKQAAAAVQEGLQRRLTTAHAHERIRRRGYLGRRQSAISPSIGYVEDDWIDRIGMLGTFRARGFCQRVRPRV